MSYWLIFSSVFVSVGIISIGSFLIFKSSAKRKNKNFFENTFFTEEGEEILKLEEELVLLRREFVKNSNRKGRVFSES